MGGVNIGVFITAVVSFVVLSAILFFGVVKPYETVKNMGKKPTDDSATPPSSEELLLSLIHISEPTRLLSIPYAVSCLKKKNK